MSCRLETWPRETTTVTLTLLSRSTSYLGEGERWACSNLQECLVCVSLSASVSVLFTLPYFFLTLYWLRCMELTNYLSLYKRMRMDMMTWGSHLSLIWFNLYESMDGCFRRYTKQREEVSCHTLCHIMIKSKDLVKDSLHFCKHTPQYAEFASSFYLVLPPSIMSLAFSSYLVCSIVFPWVCE